MAGQVDQSTQPNHELVSTIVFSKVREDPGCTPALWFELFLMNPDGTNLRQLTDSNGCTHGDTLANLSPDGKKIVFDSNRLTTGTGFRNVADLFLMNSDGMEQTRLTRGSSATWSPDGKNIAFHASASYHASGGQITLPPINANPGAPTIDSDIFVANADDLLAGTTVPTNFTKSEGIIEEDADWSPDGSKIATPTWSPDGQKIAFHKNSPRNQVWTLDADTRCIGGVGCTCSAQLLGGSCERQLTTDRMNLLAHWGQLRVHVPKQ